MATETPALSAPVSAETAFRGTNAALESLYYEPLKKASSALHIRDNSLRIDTVRRSESLVVDGHTRDLSFTTGASANRIANDNRWARDNDHQAEVDDLFAQWESDPLQLLSFPDLGM